MVERVLGGYAFGRTEGQQAIRQIEALLIVRNVRKHFGKVVVGMLLEFDLFHQREIAVAWPNAFGWRTQVLEDDVQLFHLRFAAEDRLQTEKLAEYAADRPHVHRAAVLLGLQQQFGRSIPERDHNRRVRLQR